MDAIVLVYDYSKNGTLQITTEDTTSTAAFAVIILICYLFGVAYNVLVISAVLSSLKLRNSPFHQILALVSAFCLVDCLTNESIAFGFLLDNQISWCEFSSAVFSLFLLSHAASLSLLCLERTLALRGRPMTCVVSITGVLTVCVFGSVISLPGIAIPEDIHYFPNRNACGTRISSVHFWTPILFLSGILFCWGFMIFFFSSSFREYANNQKEQEPVSPTSRALGANQSNVTIAFTVLLLYTVLVMPLTVSVVVAPFVDCEFAPNPWADPRKRAKVVRSVVTHELEPLFTFSRYIYNAAVPVVILSWDRLLRTRGRQLLCCRRNLISNEDSAFSKISSSPTLEKQLKTDSSDFKTPVLFATRGGLYLRVSRLANLTFPRDGFSTSSVNLTLVSNFCDLTVGSNSEPSSSISQEETPSEKAKRKLEDKRNVKFSSQVDAFSPAPSTSQDVSSRSETRVVHNPLYVKGEPIWSE